MQKQGPALFESCPEPVRGCPTESGSAQSRTLEIPLLRLMMLSSHGTRLDVAPVSLNSLPSHVAVIMDGNGRWAQRNRLPRTQGHREGTVAVRSTVQACRRLGIDSLTLYAFSAQNWRRPSTEIRLLMALLHQFLEKEREELMRRDIRLRVIGRSHLLPAPVRQLIQDVSEQTASCSGMTLTLALSYGGREEIADAVRDLASEVAAGTRSAEDIDEKCIETKLPSAEVGPVDLLIRTGGEQRLSNFVLWASAYAELYFTDKLWPDFHDEDLLAAIQEYQRRERRFGGVGSDEGSVGSAQAEANADQAVNYRASGHQASGHQARGQQVKHAPSAQEAEAQRVLESENYDPLLACSRSTGSSQSVDTQEAADPELANSELANPGLANSEFANPGLAKESPASQKSPDSQLPDSQGSARKQLKAGREVGGDQELVLCEGNASKTVREGSTMREGRAVHSPAREVSEHVLRCAQGSHRAT